jgi:glycosyltransferase involved in cell wall biosynthesis
MMQSDDQIKYSIVVPFYNEEENIPLLYQKTREVMNALREPYEMVFVDDGSTDGTYSSLLAIYDDDPHVRLVRLRRRFGQTAALKAGFDCTRGEFVIAMDGDLQHEPSEIPMFIEKINEGYDVVTGWRVRRSDPWLTRRLPSSVANWMMARLSGVDLHDFGTTFKAYRKEILDEVHLYGDLHRFIPAIASRLGAKIAEVPISNPERKNGKSHYGLGRTIRVLLDLLSVSFLGNYSTRPLQFFGLFGLLSTGIGAVINLFLLYRKLFLHQPILLDHGPLLLLGMTLIVSGIQFLSFGLLGEMLSRVYYETQKKPIYSVRELKNHRENAVPVAKRRGASASGG